MNNPKTIIVTGGAKSGIGEAITRNLISNNIKVIVIYQINDKMNALTLLEEYKDTNLLEISEVNFLSRESIINFCNTLNIMIDGMVNAEFFFDLENVEYPDYDIWDQSIAINLTAPNVFIHELKHKMNINSSIVIITSTEAFIGSFGASAYAMSKAAIHNLIKTFANNLGNRKIRINAIATGWIGGVMDTDEIFNMSRKITPLKRLGEPREIANIAYFVLSDASSFINGTTITADGGYTCVDTIAKYEFDSVSNSYNWIYSNINNMRKGSNIWAISMANPNEWNDSEEEKKFLDLNINAVKRGIKLQRIFVVSEKYVEQIKDNPAIRTQLENKCDNLELFLVLKEELIQNNNELFNQIGDGLTGFDLSSVFVDIANNDKERGYAVVDYAVVCKMHDMFEQLKSIAKQW